MATRVGYRALIVDDERPAHQLLQFLTRQDLNNRLIQSFYISDKLGDAYNQIEQSDFIYIDPFAFGLAEAIRFIAEVQSHSPVKAFTLFRSGRQWQERQRDIEGLALAPARLRTMLVLDKDLLNEPAFALTVRNNIGSMEREFQQELQRTGFDPARSGFTDPGVPHVGSWYAVPEYPATTRQPAYYDPGATSLAGVNPNLMANPAQMQAYIDAAVAATLRQQTRTATTPLLPPAMEAQQWQQLAPQLQQNLGTMQANLTTLQQGFAALQGAQTKLQEQVVAAQRDQRDFRGIVAGTEQRTHDLETRFHVLEQEHTQLRAGQRLTQIVLIIALMLGAAALTFGLIGTLAHR